jgi:hypothetical protein
MLDYFIFPPGIDNPNKKWVAYCPKLKDKTYGKEIRILGDSMLLHNSTKYIMKNYKDDMSSICKKCPEFTLYAKGILKIKNKNIIIENKNYKYSSNKKNKQEYLIKVKKQMDSRCWEISGEENATYTTNNIHILTECETITDVNSIKTYGFFYKKLNIISPTDMLI